MDVGKHLPDARENAHRLTDAGWETATADLDWRAELLGRQSRA